VNENILRNAYVISLKLVYREIDQEGCVNMCVNKVNIVYLAAFVFCFVHSNFGEGWVEVIYFPFT